MSSEGEAARGCAGVAGGEGRLSGLVERKVFVAAETPGMSSEGDAEVRWGKEEDAGMLRVGEVERDCVAVAEEAGMFSGLVARVFVFVGEEAAAVVLVGEGEGGAGEDGVVGGSLVPADWVEEGRVLFLAEWREERAVLPEA